LAFKNGVKSIQTAGYNGARTVSNFYLKYCIHLFQKERCVAKTISAVMTIWILAKPGSPQALVEVSNKIPRGVESQMNSNFRTNIMKIAV
jgi:hypothetical protein